MPEKLHVGVVGGGIGRHHVRAYQHLPEQFKVVAICDLEQEKLDKLKTQYTYVDTTRDYGSLVDRSDLDAVVDRSER